MARGSITPDERAGQVIGTLNGQNIVFGVGRQLPAGDAGGDG